MLAEGFLPSAPTPYRVVAELPGFETATMTVNADIGSSAPVNIRIRVGCLAEYLEVIPDLFHSNQLRTITEDAVRMRVVGAIALVAATSILRGGSSVEAQPRNCLHGANESESNRARRQQALRWIELVNRQQTSIRVRIGEFIRDIDVTGVDAVPTSWVSQIVASKTTYAVSVKDMTDPCRFAYFSDQGAIVYGGQQVF